MNDTDGRRTRERLGETGQPSVDYYALLGVPPGASAGAIRAAFRRLAKQWHPDASKVASTAERFRLIVEAYDVLSDPARRLAYDARQGGRVAAGGTYGPAGAYVAYGAEVAGGSAPASGAAKTASRRVDGVPLRPRPAATSGAGHGASQGGTPGATRGAARPGGSTGSTGSTGSSAVTGAGRPTRPARRGAPAEPVTAVAPVGAIGAVSAGVRARRAAAVGSAPVTRTVCVECGAPAVGNTDRCMTCLRKYGTFQEHLARAAARIRR